MLKSLKYRLRPTKKREKVLLAHIEECRLLYNQLVCARVQAWQKNKESLSRYEQWSYPASVAYLGLVFQACD